MGIQADAKKILRHLLDLAIENGDLEYQSDLDYGSLGKIVGFNADYCKVCCQYLDGKGAVRVSCDDLSRSIWLTAYGVDLLEG